MSDVSATSNPPVRIGSRGSKLALWQAHWVETRLAVAGVPTQIVLIRTAGDDRAPDTTWGEGAFVTAIERALLDGTIDAAVHSAKDVPTTEDPRLAIAAWTVREDPRDALVCRIRGTTLATLPPGARVGTDSPRRGAFLRSVRPDLRIHPLSGNVDTRLRKLDDDESDALVLAVAGLTRLGLADRIDEVLDTDFSLPAPGQGALALQVRAGDTRTLAALARLDDPATRYAVEAERAFLAATGGGCRSPIGALGTVADGILTLRVAAERAVALPGAEALLGGIVRAQAASPAADRLQLAADLAATIVARRSRGRVLVTRPVAQAASLVDALAALDLDAVVVPAIAVSSLPAGGPLDEALAAGMTGRWLVATSPNGVRCALEALARAGIDAAEPQWAVVGSASGLLVQDAGGDPFTPSIATSEALAAELPVLPGEPVLLVRGDLADPSTAASLAAHGAVVTDVIAYRTVEAPEASRVALEAALTDPIDAIAFASPSAVRGLLDLARPETVDRLLAVPAVCIGSTTGAAALMAGFPIVVTSPAEASSTYASAIHDAIAAATSRVTRAGGGLAPSPIASPTTVASGGAR